MSPGLDSKLLSFQYPACTPHLILVTHVIRPLFTACWIVVSFMQTQWALRERGAIIPQGVNESKAKDLVATAKNPQRIARIDRLHY